VTANLHELMTSQRIRW